MSSKLNTSVCLFALSILEWIVTIRKKRKAALKSGRTQTERAKPREANTETN